MYIHKSNCISPQEDPLQADISLLNTPVDKKLMAVEPSYDKIPSGVLRRMGKAIRMGVGTALPLMDQQDPLDGIIIGSAHAGLEECVKFLIQIVDYDEGQLTPGNFVQSTGNVIAGQLGLISKNKSYNITHIHQGLAFENAMIDAWMQLNAHPSHAYLLGGVDEISSYHYNIEALNHAYKKEDISNQHLYEFDSTGCLPGEGAAMFVVNKQKAGAVAQVKAVHTVHTGDVDLVQNLLVEFLEKNKPAEEEIDLMLSGENGDSLTLPFYTACESVLKADTAVVRYKHLSGDSPTASAIGLWYAIQILQNNQVPLHMFKKGSPGDKCRNILMYNNYKGYQHSFILVSKT